MISLEEAQERILAAIEPLPAEEIPVQDALGRYLAAPIHSPVDLPPADNSAMDGYAVRAADLASATEENPVALRLSGRDAGGKRICRRRRGGGVCADFYGGGAAARRGRRRHAGRCETGGGPAREDHLFGEGQAVENVRLRGEDIRENALLAGAGEELTAQRLSLLAGAGLAAAQAGRRPVVGLLATGDELREAGRALPPGMIYESTRAGLVRPGPPGRGHPQSCIRRLRTI